MYSVAGNGDVTFDTGEKIALIYPRRFSPVPFFVFSVLLFFRLFCSSTPMPMFPFRYTRQMQQNKSYIRHASSQRSCFIFSHQHLSALMLIITSNYPCRLCRLWSAQSCQIVSRRPASACAAWAVRSTSLAPCSSTSRPERHPAAPNVSRRGASGRDLARRCLSR